MSYIPRNATPERFASEVGNFGFNAVLRQLNKQRPGHTFTRETLEAIVAANPLAYADGKMTYTKRFNGDKKKDVTTLQESPVKNTCRHIVVEALAAVYGEAQPKEPLRLVSLPGTEFKAEKLMLNHPKLQGKIGEVVGVEAFPDMIPAVETSARQLCLAYPGVKFTVFQGRDTDLTDAGRVALDPDAGVNLIWLDEMTFFTLSTRTALEKLMSNSYMFERAWNEGKPALLFVTFRAQFEAKCNREFLKSEAAATTNILPGASITDTKNVNHQFRLQGLAGFLSRLGAENGVDVKPLTQIIYKHNAGRGGSVMLLCGFELRKGPTQSYTLEAERVMPIRDTATAS